MTARTKHGDVIAYDLDTGAPVVEDRIWLRGHLTDDEARTNAAAVLAEHELDGVPGKVEHKHVRNIPRHDRDGGWSVRACEPGRGAYAITIVTVEAA